jgi:hypothetical protein
VRILLICVAATVAVALLLPGRAAPAGVVTAQATPTATPVYPIPTPTPTATPTPSPTPTGTPPPRGSSLALLIMAVRSPSLHGRTLAWSVRCLPHACHALLVARVKIGKKGRSRRVATVRRRVPSTGARRLTVRVARDEVRAIRRAWRRHRKVFADVRGAATDGHNTASFRLHARLRPPGS